MIIEMLIGGILPLVGFVTGAGVVLTTLRMMERHDRGTDH